MISKKDLQQLKSKQLSENDIAIQLKNFKQGFPFIDIVRPAIKEDGIKVLSEQEADAYIKLYSDLKPDSIKFVPASGAASRMFKFLFEFVENGNEQYSNIDDIENGDVKAFVRNISKFAFYKDLKNILSQNNLDIVDLVNKGRYKDIIKYLLSDIGLNYGQKPKGVLLFHSYNEYLIRTAFEEHLIEGIKYAQTSDQKVRIHFTISLEHEPLFVEILNRVQEKLESEYQVKFEISFSQQKPSTDMLAVDLDNNLVRTDDGKLLFRPGGHGALIENLNDLDADVIFIKNIDNVIPEQLNEQGVLYKKALAGILISYQQQIFNYLQILDEGNITPELLNEIKDFINGELCYNFSGEINPDLIKNILNRPIRVCGMVKNEGEPGGGPFWVRHNSTTLDLQIVESAQIDLKNKEKAEIVKKASHFNPVDLVCSTKNYKNEKFDLLKYRDLNTGFISQKSQNGKELKAQELPGLWNGAMANWNTVFVEVPSITFNPVKTVNDLLRNEHQV